MSFGFAFEMKPAVDPVLVTAIIPSAFIDSLKSLAATAIDSQSDFVMSSFSYSNVLNFSRIKSLTLF